MFTNRLSNTLGSNSLTRSILVTNLSISVQLIHILWIYHNLQQFDIWILSSKSCWCSVLRLSLLTPSLYAAVPPPGLGELTATCGEPAPETVFSWLYLLPHLAAPPGCTNPLTLTSALIPLILLSFHHTHNSNYVPIKICPFHYYSIDAEHW